MAKIHFRLNSNTGRGERKRKLRSIRVRVSLGFSTSIGANTTYQPIEFGTGCSVEGDQWDRESQRTSPRADRGRGLRACTDWQYINETLDAIQVRCMAIASELRTEEIAGNAVTYEEAKARYLQDGILSKLRGVLISRRVVYSDGVFEFISSEIEASPDSEGTKISKRNTLKHLEEYHEYSHPETPMYWERFNSDYLAGFVRYLQEIKKHSEVTANKALKNAKVFHRLGVEAGKVKELGAMKGVKLKEPDSTKVYVTEEEIRAIQALPLEADSTKAVVRDWFLIACGTGLRVSDLLRLTPEHIKPSSIEGVSKQIEIVTQKTKQAVIIPFLFPCLIDTVERLGGVFPKRLEPQTLNREIKHICKEAGLTATSERTDKSGGTLQKWEAVTMHTGRHTFATLSHIRGIRPELIAEITGHKSLGVLDKHYNRQTHLDKLNGFAQAFQRSEAERKNYK